MVWELEAYHSTSNVCNTEAITLALLFGKIGQHSFKKERNNIKLS